MALYDKTGRKIFTGDLLKVFHFTGARRKKYYMYKYVLGKKIVTSGYKYYKLSHLDPKESYYLILDGGSLLSDYEIVQGDRYEDRKIEVDLKNDG